MKRGLCGSYHNHAMQWSMRWSIWFRPSWDKVKPYYQFLFVILLFKCLVIADRVKLEKEQELNIKNNISFDWKFNKYQQLKSFHLSNFLKIKLTNWELFYSICSVLNFILFCVWDPDKVWDNKMRSQKYLQIPLECKYTCVGFRVLC